MNDDWFFYPHGGPYSVEELQRRYPQIDEVALDIRRKCVASPLYLASEILSVAWPNPDLLQTPSAKHREVEQAILDQVNALYVDSRGTAKTTVLVETASVHQGIRFPNDTQLLTHSTDPNAIALSRSVRFHPTKNARFRGIFPEYALPDNEEGNIKGWSWPCRTRGGREHSIEVATAGASTAGRHYHVVRCSDWMNEQTTPLYGNATVENMNEKVALFSQVQGLLLGKEVCSRVHYTIDSNRWHDADLAGTLIRKDRGRGIIRKIIGGVTGEPGAFVSSWPEVKTPAMIQAIWDDPAMTDRMFAANYRGEPMPDSRVAFLREQFLDYDEDPMVLDVGITMDCAFSDSKTASKKTDRSAIVVSGFDSAQHFYLLDEAAGSWDETECVEQLIRLMDLWKPAWGVGIEETGASRAIINIFQRECRMTGRFINYREIKPGGKSKEARISNLHYIARRWGIRVKAGRCPQTIDELLRFGIAAHDDLADAAAYRVMDQYAPHARTPGPAPVAIDNPRNLPTGSDVLKVIQGRARAAAMMPWDAVLSGRN